MSFHSILFPPHLSHGTAGGAGFNTSIQQSDSGYERRSADWDMNLHRLQYDVAKSIQTPEDVAEVLDFYLCMRGAAHGFRFKDPIDWSSAENGTSYPTTVEDAHVAYGWTPGTTSKVFYLQKTYKNGLGVNAEGYNRKITRPIPPDDDDHRMLVFINGQLVWRSIGSGPETIAQGVTVAVDYSLGRLIFNNAPAGEVRVAFTYHVPVRFGQEADDQLDIQWEEPGVFSINTLPIVEITKDPPSHQEEWLMYGHDIKDFGNSHGGAQPFPGMYREFSMSNAGQFVLPMFHTQSTADPSPLTPLVSGEYYTGGPMYLVSNTSPTSSPLTVAQRAANGNFSAIATLAVNQYVDVYWFGNTLGAKVR